MGFIRNIDQYYNIEIINKFYKSIKFRRFANLTPERMAEIDKKASIFGRNIRTKYQTAPAIMSFLAEKRMIYRDNFNFENDDEIAYFYIKIVDPKMIFLELNCIAENNEQLRQLCRTRFGIYDNVIIYLEQTLSNRLQQIENLKSQNI